MRYALLAMLLILTAAKSVIAVAGNIPDGSLTVGPGGFTSQWLNPTGYDFNTNRHSLDLTAAGTPVVFTGIIDARLAPLPPTGLWSRYYFWLRLRDISGKRAQFVVNTDWLGSWRGIPAQPWDRIRMEREAPIVAGPALFFSTLGGQTDDGGGWIYGSDRTYQFAYTVDPVAQNAALRVFAKGRSNVDVKEWHTIGTMDLSSYGFDFTQTELLADLWCEDTSATVSFSNLNMGPNVYQVWPGLLATTPAEFVTNPFGFDWDSVAPVAATGAPAGFGATSFSAAVDASCGVAAGRYRSLRVNPEALFEHSVMISDIASMSYSTMNNGSPTDWRYTIYTKPTTVGDGSSWYHSRFASDGNPAGDGTWKTWSTDSLLFRVKRVGPEVYNKTWSQVTSEDPTDECMFFDLILGANSGGGTGTSQLDAVKVTLISGEAAILDLTDLSPDPSGNLTLTASDTCLKAGDTVTVTLSQSDLTDLVNGFQAFLSFDTSALQFVSGSYTASPYGQPTITPTATVDGKIDLSAGIALFPSPGQNPTMADADLATLTFAVKAGGNSASAVSFRTNTPPTRFTDGLGNEVPATTAIAGLIIVDSTPPAITCPGPITVESPAPVPPPATDLASFQALGGTATDANGVTVAFVGDTAAGTCPTTITRTYQATDCAGNVSTCTQTIAVDDTIAPAITCPADVTVEAGGQTDPPSTGVATAIDAGSTPAITYNDDRSHLTLCNATGYILRTWTATDACGNSSTCEQKITVVDTTPPVISGCPGDITVSNDAGACSALVSWTAPTAVDVRFDEGFEDAQWTAGPWATNPSVNWNEYNSAMARATTGTDGITSKTGSAHAVINSTVLPASPNDSSGAFCRLGGYSAVFGAGFKTSVDVYMDLTDPKVATSTYGFDVSTAASTQANGHLRDFIFHTAGVPNKILVAASNGTNFARRGDLAALNHYEITASGWDTFEWNFRDNGGALAVDCNLKDAAGTVLWTETKSAPADLIASVVGGNRYMWFTFVAADKLAVDNTRLVRNVPVTCAPASGSTFNVGTTPVTCTATDACNNVANCSFNVIVNDTEAPSITCPLPVTVQADAGHSYATGVVLGTPVTSDNCGGAVTVSNDAPAQFPAGPTVVKWTAKDSANNANTCTQTVTVANTVTADITVQLEGVTASVTRTIMFQFGGAGSGTNNYSGPVPVTFTSGSGVAHITTLPAGVNWTCVTAKDEQHTLLSNTGLALDPPLVGTKDVASFTGGDKLLGGDLTNDNLVDILDFGVFSGQYGQHPALSTTWPIKNADTSCSGTVDSGDFSYFTTVGRFLTFGEGLCGNAASIVSMPRASMTVREMGAVIGLPAAYKADMNRDGKVDAKDIALFMKQRASK